jgi:uncharacterized protein (TIGR01777 family)
MESILITGGTGMIGKALTNALVSNGYQVIILTRRAKRSANNIVYKEWDPEKGTIDGAAITEADYIIHLAGANVAESRWTAKRKKEIVDSRVRSGELLVKAIRNTPNNIKAVISASAIGWYGPDPQVPNPKPFIETDPADEAFLGRTCQQWEGAIKPVEEMGKRLVVFRIGIVLSNEAGAYAEFKKPLTFGTATILGSGKQVISWIHIDDLVGLFITAIQNERLQGEYNAVTPYPVSNKELILSLAKQRGKFYVPVPVPSFALKMALGEMSVEVLKSATVSSEKIKRAGYKFTYPHITDAVKALEEK